MPVFTANAQSPSQHDADRDAPDSRIGLADLPAYHVALAGKEDETREKGAKPASFRDLWDRPDAWKGRRVEIRGRVARVFRQDPVGSFPALAEVWLSTSDGDLFCVHCPIPPRGESPSEMIPKIGTSVHFKGIFLKIIRYPAGDQARLAPLVVGRRPPEAEGESVVPTRSHTVNPWPLTLPPTAWAAGAVIGLTAAGILAWRHLRGPSRPTVQTDAAPEFLDERAPR